MGLWDEITRRIATAPADHMPVEVIEAQNPAPNRALSYPTLNDKIAAVLRDRQYAPRPWRPATIDEALGVPANLAAVTLISNMCGIFTLEGYQNGRKVPNDDRPRIIQRPNPFTTLRDYLREYAWSMATRGENWQWIAARGADSEALSLIPVPSKEVEASGDWISPKVSWRKRDKTSDMVGLFLTKELGATRGKGPLQYCGSAVSAAVESQEWAANFFATGGHPPIVIHSDDELSEEEAQALQAAWTATPPNMPQVTSGPMDAKQLATNEGSAQLLDARNWNAGEASRMWLIPGPLLEYSRGGSSLTYANVVALVDQLLKQCLIPNYLEPLEQTISDLLPRTWAARFNVDAVLRADIKTRFEVYESGLRSGVYSDPSEARAIEGLDPGSVENAPTPYSPPAAYPTAIPRNDRRFSTEEWRCDNCGKKLAETRGRGTTLRCRCGVLAVA